MDAKPALDARTLLLGFACGYLAVLTFHQTTILVLWYFDLARGFPWSFRPVPLFGAPAVLQAAFWGGIWGGLIAACRVYVPPGPARYVYGLLWGGVLCAAFGWYVVAPLKGNAPPAFGFTTMWRGMLINGMYGLGTVVLLELADRFLPRRRNEPPPPEPMADA
jgi:hypothetical protein